MKMKPALLALVVGIMLVTAAIAGAATSKPVHWPAGCVKFTCVNNHLNALHRRVHDANMRAMTPGPAGATGATGAQGLQGDSGPLARSARRVLLGRRVTRVRPAKSAPPVTRVIRATSAPSALRATPATPAHRPP